MDRSPIVGITGHLEGERHAVRRAYVEAVREAGGTPLLLPAPADPEEARRMARKHAFVCDALVLTGGDDPIMEAFGVTTDPRVTPIDPGRQAHELELLAARPGMPILGVCLGMQLMALAAGGTLNQWLADTTPTHADHWNDHAHAIEPTTDDWPNLRGTVTSHHRQAVADAGALRVIATAPDGVIEAIDDPEAPFRVGVQWHPERTAEPTLGLEFFRRLVEAAGG
jgi:putative glutamine amidotransferase